MTAATGRKAPWYTQDYLRLASATHDAGVLTVGFADGSTARVPVEALDLGRQQGIHWNELFHTVYEIVVPTTGEQLEIPWDVIRSLTDPAFEEHLAATAAASARRTGRKLRAFRRSRDLSIETVAATTGVPRERLARIERGEDGTDLVALESILTALGHSWADLVDRPDEASIA